MMELNEGDYDQSMKLQSSQCSHHHAIGILLNETRFEIKSKIEAAKTQMTTKWWQRDSENSNLLLPSSGHQFFATQTW